MTAKYIIVKETIRGWIVEGTVHPKEKIASENELMITFAVSRHTIRQALGELVSEGWLYREHGVGSFVADRQRKDQNMDSKLIGVVTTYLSDYIFPSIIRGIEATLSNAGYTLLLASTNNNPDAEQQCLRTFLEKQVAGVIIEPTKSSLPNPNLREYLALAHHRIPYVMINAGYEELSPISLTLDDTKAGQVACQHLLDLGHTSIMGFFKTDDRQGLKRMNGFLKALQEKDIAPKPEWCVTYTSETKTSVPTEVLQAALRQRERPTAIVCYNDELALMLLHTIRRAGMKVPEQLSIIGCDDSHLCTASEIALTSVAHPKSQMGEDAAKLIVTMIESRERRAASHKYEPLLIERQSTAPPER
ncbi:GntR family transcriptional regulator [Aureibacillus halotolerans]|uniref:GntR family transcriptional regulator n=1 Tax=Aureibacillus halotolerans TaxID=1508390 RepID=A0A4R6U8M6_9BACI|nr:GntR family transcriptional regulator [Aureibacillus halotolerans]TDQ42751.1 GntR family transcriptional regulator [Aureibacillus halotolerans]